jgi:putative peptidoglycan lipid II flippase
VTDDPAAAAAPAPSGPPSRSLLRASVGPVLGTTLSRATGLVRVAALTSALGLTTFADVYNLANTLPNVLYELVLGGVLSSTLVPLFVRALDDPEDDGPSAVVTVAFVAVAGLTLAAVLVSPLVNLLFAAPLTGDDRQQQLTTGAALMALLVPQILFYGVTTLITGLLTARRRFAPPAFTPVLTNLVTAAAALAAGHWVATDLAGAPSTAQVYLLGLGTTAGVAAMAVTLVPFVRRSGIDLRWRFRPRHPAVRQVLRLSGWMIGYTAANQVALLVILGIARTQDPGSVSAYQYAFIFFQLPHGLIAVSLMTAVLPELAAAAVDEDAPAYRRHFREGLSLLLTFLLPAAVGLWFLAEPLVRLLLQRGNFDATDSARTAEMLAGFALGLPAFSVFLYCVRAFFARKDTRTPFLLNLGENTLNVVLVLPLLALLGQPGLSVSYSIAYWVAAAAALVVLHRRVGDLVGRGTLAALARPVGVGILVAAAVAVTRLLDVGEGAGSAVAEITVALVVAVIAMAVGIALLRPEGLEPVTRRLPWSPHHRSRERTGSDGGRSG